MFFQHYMTITFAVHTYKGIFNVKNINGDLRICCLNQYQISPMQENTHCWGKHHCMAGLQFNKTGTAQ